LFEELTLNAWPPLETQLFDGWLLGYSDGYTRRANSVQPLYASTLPLADKIEWCKAAYVARGVSVTFKIPSGCADQALDGLLGERGYELAALTSVQTCDLSSVALADGDVVLSASLEDLWFEAFNRLTATPASLQSAERRLLAKIGPPHRFASVVRDGDIVALGLGVQERDYVGLFDIVVDARLRNQGLGRRLCSALLAWGAASGARGGYLGVMRDNAPALHLYAGLGFSEAYTYWYRYAPTAPA